MVCLCENGVGLFLVSAYADLAVCAWEALTSSKEQEEGRV